MPCDTVQLNELNMIGLNLDILAKSLKDEGWANVLVDRKRKQVRAAGFKYDQKTGNMEVNPNGAPGSWNWYRKMGGDVVARKIKREYVSALFKQMAPKSGGWEFTLNKKGNPVLRKQKVAAGSGAFGKTFGSDASSGFTGFKWRK